MNFGLRVGSVVHYREAMTMIQVARSLRILLGNLRVCRCGCEALMFNYLSRLQGSKRLKVSIINAVRSAKRCDVCHDGMAVECRHDRSCLVMCPALPMRVKPERAVDRLVSKVGIVLSC